jgi:hypothetical protein
MTHECWNEVIHQNNIHPILPNNLRLWKQSKRLVYTVYCFCILKTSLSAEWLTSAVVSGLPL